jgi:hypothetical protein
LLLLLLWLNLSRVAVGRLLLLHLLKRGRGGLRGEPLWRRRRRRRGRRHRILMLRAVESACIRARRSPIIIFHCLI